MRIRFWGVRGSIASPGPDTAAVGRQHELRRAHVRQDPHRARRRDRAACARQPSHAARGAAPLALTLLLSHYHWDHIQGLPFFVPVYMKQASLTIVGGANGVMSVRETLERQMSAPVFPVRLKRP